MSAVAEPDILDGIAFEPLPADREHAVAGGNVIGEIALVEADDELRSAWKARMADGEWTPMRSRAEARAYVVGMSRGTWRT